MRRICFLVDGFNLYHSIRDLERDVADGRVQGASGPLHWLDIDALCASYMGAIDTSVRGRTVYYFSALAHHAEKRHPGVVARHEKYITALESTGVLPVLGSFKEKDAGCPRYRQTGIHCDFADGVECDGTFRRHEEKQTDVAIACKLVELATTDSGCSVAVIVGGDSDLVPAIETSKRLRPELRIIAALPYKRNSNDMRRAADHAITIRPEQYSKHQLPDEVTSLRGVRISKPESW